ncbi:MAG: Uma2 family endonuclease [Acidobacteriota bacterium]
MMQKITEDEFFDFCMLNKDWDIERSQKGEIIIMPPTGGESGHSNFSLIGEFAYWAKKDRTGVGFDSSTNFVLPNKAVRGPDLAWVKRERWEALTPEERRKFPPLCPDFVVELRSPSDSLTALKDKMEEYIANGAELGWLIDPRQKKVYVYRPNAEVECLENPASVSGDPLLPGFKLDLQFVW